MRLGSDAKKYPGAAALGPIELVDSAAREGLAGLFFRTMLMMSPALDAGELREIRGRIDERGMYLESGLGEVNPYGLGENPEFRAIGDGDTVLGFRRIMEAAASIGITELWAATANLKPYCGKFAYDRFRTDAPWTDQLAAVEKLLTTLAPIARDLGIHINLETHEEITSFEVVRLVEAVGPDAIGITFDTANVVQRAEHPTWAARRVAPYVRQTHLKDTALFHGDNGVLYQMRPNGEGVVDLGAILPIIFEANPEVNLSLELDEARPAAVTTASRPRNLEMSLYEPEWLVAHPDLTVDELAAYLQLVHTYETRVASEGLDNYDEHAARPFGPAEAVTFLRTSVTNVRRAAEAAGIALESAGTSAGS